jgi:NAD(P)H dehydrogenase (quinone)
MILYHSTYGHIKVMADAVAAGINSVDGAAAVLYQVPETLSEARLRKMNAPPRPSDPTLEYDEMNTILQDVAGLMLGIPTRFGMMPSQMKAWFDSTSKLWTKGHLVGKPAGCFFSSAVQGGGQETTALTTVTQFTHHGMLFVPPGYSFGGRMFDNTEVHGGSPYGAGCIAGGDGSRLPSRFELDFARHQGAQFATIALKLARD